MPSVAESIEISFKTLVAQKPYRSITVKEICEGAFVSRRTFYANFVDKRAIVAYLLRRDAIYPAARVLELLAPTDRALIASSVIERFYKGVLDNRVFYENLVRPMVGNDQTFELAVARGVYGALKKYVVSRNPQVGESDLLILYYHAAGWAIFLERWIYDGCKEAPEHLGVLQAKALVPTLRALIEDADN